MKRKKSLLISITVLVIITGTLLGYSWHNIQTDTRVREQKVDDPHVDEDSVSEIGYIYQVRREMRLWHGRRDIAWWVKVPTTNRIYYCDWMTGYPGFEHDDAVMFIHPREDDEYGYGYIVGLHDRLKGRSAAVGTVRVDDLIL